MNVEHDPRCVVVNPSLPGSNVRRFGRLRARLFRMLHMMRDQGAALELLAVLNLAGWRSGGVAFDFDANNVKAEYELDEYPCLVRDLRPCDILLRTTRPPLDDHRTAPLEHTHTKIEGDIMNSVRDVFTILGRVSGSTQVVIDEEIVPHLPDWFPRAQHCPGRREAISRELNALLRRAGWKRKEHQDLGRALGLTLIDPHAAVAKRRVRLVLSFGMDGVTGLIWNRVLATAGAKVMCDALRSEQRVLIVGSFRLVAPKPFPMDLSYVDSLEPLIAAIPIGRPRDTNTDNEHSGLHRVRELKAAG
jgi:hypothetical protein